MGVGVHICMCVWVHRVYMCFGDCVKVYEAERKREYVCVFGCMRQREFKRDIIKIHIIQRHKTHR